MSQLFTAEEIAFAKAVRDAQLNDDIPYPAGHKNAGKTKKQVREEISNGIFVPAPEFIPGADAIPPITTAPLAKKKGDAEPVKDKANAPSEKAA